MEEYFARFADRFDLFHAERPWMQDPRLTVQCDPDRTAGVNKLVTGRPGGNNHAWFEHVSASRPVQPEAGQAVLDLLVWLYYGPSGRCSTRTVLRVPCPVAPERPDPVLAVEAAVQALREAVEAASGVVGLLSGPDAEAAFAGRLGPLRKATKRSRTALLVLEKLTGPDRPPGNLVALDTAMGQAAAAVRELREAALPARPLPGGQAGTHVRAGVDVLVETAAAAATEAEAAVQTLTDREQDREAARAHTELERGARGAAAAGELPQELVVTASDCLAGPLRSALSYHPEGPNLLLTLLAGLVEPGAQVRRTQDLCPWEQQEWPDPAGEPPPAVGPCSMLTARAQHAVLLVPGHWGEQRVRDAYITWAWRERVRSAGDPYLIWQTAKSSGLPYARYANAARGLWRDLLVLLAGRGTDPADPVPPSVLRTAQDFAGLRVRALGFEQDGQAKDMQFVDQVSVLPVLDMAERRDPELARHLAALAQAGEVHGERVKRAARRAWQLFTAAQRPADCTWAADAELRYWPAAEEVFWRRASAREFAGAWAEYHGLAQRVYEEVTARAVGRARGARAVEAARDELYGAGAAKAVPAAR